MFQGMTIGEQRTLLALVVVVTAGLGYRAYRQHQSLNAVYVVRGPEWSSAGAASGAPPAPSVATPSLAPVQTPAPTEAVLGAPSPAASPAPSPTPSPAAPIALRSLSMPPGAPGAPALIDLNRATLEQLDSLRGIGPVRGRAILEYRMRVGRFHAVEELLNVNGIGEKTLESVRPFVCVRP